MKATLSYKSKRNIIIASVIVVLLAAISTAGYFYIKGNDETARAFTQNEITNELTPGEQTQNNGGQQENQTQNPEQPTTPGDQNNNGGEQTPNSQTNNGQNQNNNTTNNGSTPDQTTGDVPNQEYVRERVEERTTITKEYSVEWTPETISANASVQNLNIIRPIISANKSADKNAVVSGEIITYTITVTNTGNADGKAIVKDTIPEATEFIENSIKINGENTNYTAQNLEEGITVDVAKQNEQGEAGTVKVEFKVKVSNIFAQYEKASIINQATVNEEKTNEVKNPVIKFEKLADKESLYWNYFDKKGDIQIDWAVESDINMKKTMESEGISEEEFYQKYGQPVVTYNRFDAANFIALVEDMQKSVQNELLRADLQQLINAASLAAETHDMEYANDIYKILHDMDYFLLRYGIEDVGGYTRYDDVVSKYYGVLNVYGEDSLISE